MLVNVRFLVA